MMLGSDSHPNKASSSLNAERGNRQWVFRCIVTGHSGLS
jgi:hypothetical protein